MIFIKIYPYSEIQNDKNFKIKYNICYFLLSNFIGHIGLESPFSILSYMQVAFSTFPQIPHTAAYIVHLDSLLAIKFWRYGINFKFFVFELITSIIISCFCILSRNLLRVNLNVNSSNLKFRTQRLLLSTHRLLGLPTGLLPDG